MKQLVYILIAMAVGLTACIDDDFSTSQNDLLTFSTDTVTFDTVISQQGTATKQFIVYNRGSKQLKISNIRVAGLSDAHFYLNVDGRKGSEFRDVEVRGGDSIFVFVESYIDETKQDAPQEIVDRIDFTTNGVTQSVMLNAWAQDVVRLTADTIWESTRFTAAKPYLIYDTLLVAPGATLTLEPGTTLLFHKGAALRVYGTMKAVGTMEQPIVLRGDRLDHVVGNIDFDIMSGQWGGVIFGVGSYGNEWAFVDMRGSELGVHVSSENAGRRTLHLFNCRLHNSSSSLLTTWGAWVDAEGTEISDAENGVVNFVGGRVHLINCTLANYYLFKAVNDPILNVWIDDEAGSVSPLVCHLDNCIIYGNADDINFGNLDDSQIYLRNCLLKANGTDDANFINIKWKGDPKFYVEREKYIFDYRLKNESDAIAAGDRSLCPASARYDRYGQDRFAREGIDLGAYVWVPAEAAQQ
ncbi:MAG: hypothetical protein IJ808_00665 [Muribaculaceae bacterium]|nr:hypothetical protein [Muribaculaceae bacterium]